MPHKGLLVEVENSLTDNVIRLLLNFLKQQKVYLTKGYLGSMFIFINVFYGIP